MRKNDFARVFYLRGSILDSWQIENGTLANIKTRAALTNGPTHIDALAHAGALLSASHTAPDRASYNRGMETTAEAPEAWVCQNPACGHLFAEYVNGCPCCYVDELDAKDGKRFVAGVRHRRIEL